ncbi:MAG: dTDP-4-dehydrorhamnose 3,5-epimerase [Gammaproteobacteria bacterium]
MRVLATRLPGVLVLEPTRHRDARGFFCETYNRQVFAQATGFDSDFVQDNHSHSIRGTLRGLHYQINHPQGKLVRVVAGRVFDVAIDLRRSSRHFGSWIGIELDSESGREVWIPPGFGHGFLTLSKSADLLYKTTEYWDQASDRSLRWNDPDLGIEWPHEDLAGGDPLLSDKDRAAPGLAEAEVFP